MNTESGRRCIAFENSRCVASGLLQEVVLEIKRSLNQEQIGGVLIFDSDTSQPVEVDLTGTSEEVLARITPAAKNAAGGATSGKRGRGRPRLGVVSREVTLLPRHWAWLNGQSGGASVTLRKLVAQARRDDTGKERIRKFQNSAYGFMSAMAGNEPGFEEATRALFRGDASLFQSQVAHWPEDVRMHVQKLANPVFADHRVSNTEGNRND